MMNNKTIAILVVAGLIMVAGAAAVISFSKENNEPPGALEDYYGNTFTLSKPVERSVVESGGALRLVTYMGEEASKTVVGTNSTYSAGKGVTQYSYVHDFSSVATLGKFKSSAENIIALNPDIVIIGSSSPTLSDDHVSIIETLRSAGIPTCTVRYLDDVTHEDYKTQVKLIGKIFGTGDVADKLISETDKILNDLDMRMSKTTGSEGVYVGGVAFAGTKDFLWTNAAYGGFLYLGDRIDNIAVKLNPSATYQVSTDWEKIYNLNSDIDAVFVDLAGYNLVKDQWSNGEGKFTAITAIGNGDFYYVLPQTSSGTCHDNTLVAAYVIGSILFPEQFGDIDIEKTAKMIFSIFYNGSDSAGADVYNGISESIRKSYGPSELGGKITF